MPSAGLNVQVSDTTDDQSSKKAEFINAFLKYQWYHICLKTKTSGVIPEVFVFQV